MKKIFYLYSKSLLSKLALVAILIVGGGNFVWAQKSLPYSYGFENNDLSKEGWTMTNCYSSGYPSTSTGVYSLSNGPYAGSYAFRFYGYSDYNSQCLISPELASSTTGIEVSFHYKCSGTSPQQKFKVGYSSTGTDVSNFTWDTETSYNNSTTWAEYDTSFPTGTKYIAVMYTSSTQYTNLYLDGFEIKAEDPYKTPTGFAVDSYDATSATFSWTAGNSETTWQFDYSTNADFTPGEGINGTSVSITDNPYTLTGLTTGTTYYAAIRADYGSGNYSEWTDKVSFTPKAEVETTINDVNTTTNSYIPFYGSGATTSTSSQFIIPSSQLSAISSRQITKLVFYCSAETRSYGTAQWEVYLKETDNTTYSSYSFESWGTKVFNSAILSVSDYKMEITLNTPFNYSGKNLMIGFKQTVSGSGNYSSFVCVSTSDNVGYSFSNNDNKYIKCYPKLTIISVPITTDPVQMGLNGYTTFASPRALDLAKLPSGLKAYKASTIDGTRVRFTEIDDVVAANTGILLEGTASETYNIPVATTSGNDISGSNLFFVNSTGGTFTAESGYTYYGMIKATSAADPIVFGTFAPGSVAIPTNRAYLKVANPGGTSRLTCVFDNGETTGVQTVNAEPLTVNQYFDLQGRRVAQPTRGLYIVNGKKVVIK